MAGAADGTILSQDGREGNKDAGGGEGGDTSKVDGRVSGDMRMGAYVPMLPQWRIRAKIVAYMDMIVMAVYMGFCAAFFTQVTVHLVTVTEKRCGENLWGGENVDLSHVKALLGSVWIVLFAGMLGRCVALWTSVKLLQATLFAQSRSEAEKLTWLWRALTVAGFFVAPVIMAVFGVAVYLIPMSTFFLCFIFSSMTLLAYDMFWRLVSYWVVSRFLKAIRETGVNSGGVLVI